MSNTLERILNRFNLDSQADYSQHKAPIHFPDFTRNELAGLFGELGLKRGVEVGTETGHYAKALCAFNPGVKLYCVDAWQAYNGYRDHVFQHKLEKMYETTKERLAKFDVEIIRDWSMDAVRRFEPESLDFVYIDANHTFDWVMQDIIEWSKRVRPGGIVSGHDFTRRKGWHVVQAVEMYTYIHAIRPVFSCDGEQNSHEARSFFWVKP